MPKKFPKLNWETNEIYSINKTLNNYNYHFNIEERKDTKRLMLWEKG